jgi:hypothetical protein
VDVRALERLEQVAAEDQGHQLRGRETERGKAPEAVEELPARVAVHLVGRQRKADGFQRREVPPQRAEMPGELGGQASGQLFEREGGRAFQPPQEVPLPDDLVVARHEALIVP